MELVEGETLQERLKRGPIPVEESLPMAAQIVSSVMSLKLPKNGKRVRVVEQHLGLATTAIAV